MTSYQRRLRDIAYLKQSLEETRELCEAIVERAASEGHPVTIPFAKRGIKDTDFITDIDQFAMRLHVTEKMPNERPPCEKCGKRHMLLRACGKVR